MFSYLFFSSFICFLGVFGVVLNRRNILTFLMSIELILLSANLNFLIFSIFFDDIKGQIFFFVVLAVAAAEAAIGLSIIVLFYHKSGSVSFNQTPNLRG